MDRETLQARHAARDGAQAGRSPVSVLPAQQLLLSIRGRAPRFWRAACACKGTRSPRCLIPPRVHEWRWSAARCRGGRSVDDRYLGGAALPASQGRAWDGKCAVILRGPDSQRNRFWAERAGAAAYVVKGRMGDLVRTLSRLFLAPPQRRFRRQLSGDTADLRDRIASHLDAALSSR